MQSARVFSVVLSTLAALTLVSSQLAAADVPAIRPNIVMIMTDDQHAGSMGYMPRTMERLAPVSVRFSNAFVTTPNCCPARAGFLSGLYSAGHGVLDNGSSNGGAQAYQPPVDVAEALSSIGYRTALYGKWMTGFDTGKVSQPRGFDEWLTFDNSSERRGGKPPDRSNFNYFNWFAVSHTGESSYGMDASDYSTDVFANAAVGFIDRQGDQPFFLQFSPFAPHLPANPAPRHAEIDLAAITISKSPAYGKIVKNGQWGERYGDEEWQKREAAIVSRTKRQIVSLYAVDDAVDALMTALERNGLDKNTVIIFSSDNGFAWGERRWNHKLCPYDECIRVPLLVHVPDGILAKAVLPADNRQIVSNLDVARTILALVGSDRESQASDGVSLVPTLLDPTQSVRDRLYLEMYGTGGRLPRALRPWQGIRTQTRKFVRLANHRLELFDLDKDPFELVNVAADPAYAEELARFGTELDDALGLQVSREPLALEYENGQCSPDSGQVRFRTTDAIHADRAVRIVSASLSLPASREVRIDRLDDYRVSLNFPRGGAIEFTGNRMQLFRLENHDWLVHILPEHLQRRFRDPGVVLEIRSPQTAVLETLCNNNPAIEFDVVTKSH